VPAGPPSVSLGEGRTPLVWAEFDGRRAALKCEFQNPTGSFKDRGAAALVSELAARGIDAVVEDSSGNAGAALAAYCARAGIRATIFVPGSASGPKLAQIATYGADVVRVPGPRAFATAAAMEAVGAGAVYASHALLPFHPAGYATMARELVDQLGGVAPGSVVAPAGQGGLLLGLAAGFSGLARDGIIARVPSLIGVQAAACAPLARAFADDGGDADAGPAGPTVAEGVAVAAPARAAEVIAAVRASGGRIPVVPEDRILPARDCLARAGFLVEPTSALVLDALRQCPDVPEPVVLILTGSGLKASGIGDGVRKIGG
jgi:threonine synthase